MFTFIPGSQTPQTNKKALQLTDKMLRLAEDLYLLELSNDSLYACGESVTFKMAGCYGLYETYNGEIVSFQPKSSLNFTVTCGDLVTSGSLATIKATTAYLDDYTLFVDE
jgi:hypothetical protein